MRDDLWALMPYAGFILVGILLVAGLPKKKKEEEPEALEEDEDDDDDD